MRAPAATEDLLEEVFSAAGIPYALQRRRPFADTAIGRALIGLLHCVPGAGEKEAGELGDSGGGELGDLLAWLRAPGLLTTRAKARRAGPGAVGARSLRTGSS